MTDGVADRAAGATGSQKDRRPGRRGGQGARGLMVGAGAQRPSERWREPRPSASPPWPLARHDEVGAAVVVRKGDKPPSAWRLLERTD